MSLFRWTFFFFPSIFRKTFNLTSYFSSLSSLNCCNFSRRLNNVPTFLTHLHLNRNFQSIAFNFLHVYMCVYISIHVCSRAWVCVCFTVYAYM